MQRRVFISCSLAAIALGTATFAGTAAAQNAVPDAALFIRELSQKAIAQLTGQDIPDSERARRFSILLHDNFDVAAIGRFVLGRYWRLATDAERDEYLKLFEQYLVLSYANRFKQYTGENLRVDQTRTGVDNEIIINSTILRSEIGPAPVTWRAHRDGSGFKIFDVAVEGVSMAITHRDDFAAVIQRGGGKVEALLALLRGKVKEGRLV